MNLTIKKILPILIIAIVLAINFSLGVTRLSEYSAVDEPYWTYDRTPDFWKAIAKQEWKKTNINDKPGITVAILSGYGLTKYNPIAYKSLRDEPKTAAQLKDINAINFNFRLPIFLASILLLPLFYFLLKKLMGETTALLSFVFIGLSPILLGISLIINPDSLLWLFLPFSLLSYLVFQKEDNKHYLWIASFFLGLSLLTKYVSNILYIFFFFLPFLEYIFAKEKPELKAYLKKSVKDYLIIAFISMATFYLLYPATWTHPNLLLKGTFLSKAFETTWPLFIGLIALIMLDLLLLKNKVTHWILNFVSKYRQSLIRLIFGFFIFAIAFIFLDIFLGMKPFNFEGIISSPKGIGSDSIAIAYSGAILANIYSLIFGISPVAFLGLITAIFFAAKKINCHSIETKITFYFIIFILFYYLASTVNDVIATVRYQIILYPLVLIISAIGISQMISLKSINKYIPKDIGYFATIIILTITLLSVRPFYFSYASALLPQKYLLNFKDMGDGSYEAAKFLNSLPDAQNLSIWSDKGAVCAEFIGKCNISLKKKDLENTNFDYFVISTGRRSRTVKLSNGVNENIDFKKAYTENEYIHNITLANRPNNFVRIVDAKILKK